MIIWGSKARKTNGQTGEFFCPSCKETRRYTTIKWSRYFTLYFIPLFPMETLSTYVHCNACQGDFNSTILNHSREQILSATSPWSCSSCSNLNAAESKDCLACGQSRSQPDTVAA